MAGTFRNSLRREPRIWTFTNNMNMRDLSRDDDFISYMLVETFGTDDVPLLVHRMDPSRRLQKINPDEVLNIVKKWLLFTKTTPAKRIRGAVDALLRLPPVFHYIRYHHLSTSQLNAFATHAARYLEIYLPTSTIEISHTSRYSHRTGKAELCILATRPLPVGAVITELKGSMAALTEEENEELKRTDKRNTQGIRRDFSVIHSGHRKKNHLFLGPARFVNHDCDNNCELIREGRYITFRVLKPISSGQELTAHYGNSYFGKGNRHCLCETCEKNGRGGYRVDPYTDSDHSSDSDVSEISVRRSIGKDQVLGAANERRTRRGVYTTLPSSGSDPESSEEEDYGDGKEQYPVVPEAVRKIEHAEENVIQIASEAQGHTALTPISTSPSLDRFSLQPPAPGPSKISTHIIPDIIDLTAPLSPLSPVTAALSPLTVCADEDLNANLDAGRGDILANDREDDTSQADSTNPLHINSVIPDQPRRLSSRTTLRPPSVSRRSFKFSQDNPSTLRPKQEARPDAPITSYALPSPSTSGSKAASRTGSVLDPTPSSSTTIPARVKVEPLDDTPLLNNAKNRSSISPRKQKTPAKKSSESAQRSVKDSNTSSRVLNGTASTLSPTKRGRKPRVPKTCSTCSVILVVNSAATDCPRCQRHLKIFGAPWPSRAPKLIVPLPSPTPERSPERIKRTHSVDVLLDSNRHKRQRTGILNSQRLGRPSLHTTKSNDSGSLDRRLSKQEVRRRRKNERRRLARALARAEKFKGENGHIKQGYSFDESENDDESDSDAAVVRLLPIMQARRSFSNFPRTRQPRSAYVHLLGRNPNAFACKTWSQYDNELEDSVSETCASDASETEFVESSPAGTYIAVKSDPHWFAKSKRVIRLDEEKPNIDLETEEQSYFTFPEPTKTYLSSASPSRSQQNAIIRSLRNSRTGSSYIDPLLLQRTAIPEITHAEESFYFTDEDRMAIDLPYSSTSQAFSEGRSFAVLNVQGWNFHRPFRISLAAERTCIDEFGVPAHYEELGEVSNWTGDYILQNETELGPVYGFTATGKNIHVKVVSDDCEFLRSTKTSSPSSPPFLQLALTSLSVSPNPSPSDIGRLRSKGVEWDDD